MNDKKLAVMAMRLIAATADKAAFDLENNRMCEMNIDQDHGINEAINAIRALKEVKP